MGRAEFSIAIVVVFIRMQPCRAKYRGIWAILMHKMMFPSESCNSVSKGDSVPFPLSRKCSPRVPPGGTRTPVWEPMLYGTLLSKRPVQPTLANRMVTPVYADHTDRSLLNH